MVCSNTIKTSWKWNNVIIIFRLSTSTATTSCSTTCCTTSTRSSPSSAETSPHWAGLNWEPSQTNPRTNHPRLFSQTFIHFTETSSVVSVLSKVKLQNIGGWRWHKKFCPRVKINEVTFLWTLDYFGFWIYGLIKFSKYSSNLKRVKFKWSGDLHKLSLILSAIRHRR